MKASERKGTRVTLRLTPGEARALRLLAKGWGVTTGEALRRCLRLATASGKG